MGSQNLSPIISTSKQKTTLIYCNLSSRAGSRSVTMHIPLASWEKKDGIFVYSISDEQI